MVATTSGAPPRSACGGAVFDTAAVTGHEPSGDVYAIDASNSSTIPKSRQPKS